MNNFRDSAENWYTRHRTKANKKKKKHNTEKKRDEQHGYHQKAGVNPGGRKW